MTEYTSKDAAVQCHTANKLVTIKMKEAKERWTKEQCREIGKGMRQGDSKTVNTILKLLTKTQQNKSNSIQGQIPFGRELCSTGNIRRIL